jgi:hypothetical protein
MTCVLSKASIKQTDGAALHLSPKINTTYSHVSDSYRYNTYINVTRSSPDSHSDSSQHHSAYKSKNPTLLHHVVCFLRLQNVFVGRFMSGVSPRLPKEETELNMFFLQRICNSSIVNTMKDLKSNLRA